MAVYGYVRASSIQKANEGDLLEAQIKQVTSYASSRGLYLYESSVLVERVVSGQLEFNSRPEGSKLLDVIKRELFWSFLNWIEAFVILETL